MSQVQTVSTGYKPHKWQEHIQRKRRRFSVLVCHRRFGKTVAAINILIDAALRAKGQLPRFGYIAPYRNQAKSISWDYLKRFAQNIPGMKVNEGDLYVTFPHNQAQIRLFGADNADALRGLYFDGIVCDEIADYKPYVWGEVIRPALSDRKGWAIFIGTPKGVNLFHELYVHGLEDPAWYAESFPIDKTLADIPWLDNEEIELARATMSDNQYRQEFLCDFSASVENALIEIDLVTKAIHQKLHVSQYELAPRVIGVDVARFGADRSVIQRRQGLAALEPIILRDVDNMHLAGLVADEIELWQPHAVFIDGGRGEGVIDRLRQLGYSVIEVNFGGRAIDSVHFANKRTEMWFAMAEWMKSGGWIPDNEELKASLVVPTFSYDTANRKILEKKEKMKERAGFSPDPGDALALTFAYPVKVPDPLDVVDPDRARHAHTEYDMFPRKNGRKPKQKTLKRHYELFQRQ